MEICSCTGCKELTQRIPSNVVRVQRLPPTRLYQTPGYNNRQMQEFYRNHILRVDPTREEANTRLARAYPQQFEQGWAPPHRHFMTELIREEIEYNTWSYTPSNYMPVGKIKDTRINRDLDFLLPQRENV